MDAYEGTPAGTTRSMWHRMPRAFQTAISSKHGQDHEPPDSAEEIEEIARNLLLEAKAFGVFPIPVDRMGCHLIITKTRQAHLHSPKGTEPYSPPKPVTGILDVHVSKGVLPGSGWHKG
jgi:hypothetical protein